MAMRLVSAFVVALVGVLGFFPAPVARADATACGGHEVQAPSASGYDLPAAATTPTANTCLAAPRGDDGPAGRTRALTSLIAAGRAAKAGSRGTVAIGRDMGGRVVPYAERHGYDYYQGTPRLIPFRNQRLDLWFNKRWIRKEMRRGSDVVDIGEPAGMPPSPFFDMERAATRGYPNYRQDPQP